MTRKNKNLEYSLPLTISAQYGLVDQHEFFNKRIAAKDVSGYYVIKNGEFAYNKSYSEGYPWGAVKRLDRYENGVLSTLYILFSVKNVDSDFLVSYYDTNNWHSEVQQRSAEGARNHGLLNISASDFFDTELVIPQDPNEQKKIGLLFKKLDSTITLHQRKLDKLKNIKKALLEKMFPRNGENIPEVRFKGFSDDWEQRKLYELLDLLKDGTHGTHKDVECGPLLLSAKNIKQGKIIWDESDRRISRSDFNSIHAKYKLKEKDVLLTIVGSIGETAILRECKDITFQRSVAILRTNNKVLPEFLYTEIQTTAFQNELNNRKSTSAQPGIYLNDLKEIFINLPANKEEQLKIGAYFEQLDNLITLHQRKLDKLKNIKKALLEKMFV